MWLTSALYVILSICAGSIAWSAWARRRSRYPPGPRGLPVIGNLLDLPRKHEWKTFTAWRDTYGDVVYVSVLGRPLIILNSAEVAMDLMDKRSSIYSDRPRFPLVDLIGQEWNVGFMTYGKPWHARKRMILGKYTKAEVPAYRPAQRSAMRTLLKNLRDDPENFTEHLRLHSGQLIVDVTYGLSIKSREHKLIHLAEEVMDSITIGLTPLFWVFNPVPLLQKLPNWTTGGWLARTIKTWQHNDRRLRDEAFEQVKLSLDNGTARPSYTSSLLEDLRPEAGSQEEILIRDTSAVAYGAGADTALAAYTIFFLAMFQNPEVQRKAQEEIDRVVGHGRLPDYADQPDLPYITAVMKESLRWHAAAPQGIAHRLTVDDEYKGWHLPSGSMIVPNVWGILHDPVIYPDPARFYPERFFRDGKLDFTGRDPASVVFGFGRRICAGEHFAQDTLYLLVAQFLAVFSITTVDGGPPPPVDMTSGGVSFPCPYKCLIRPRSEAARVLLEQVLMSADDQS
ncbi:cytochrome P450 [Auriscalpium vulgare]|uniref:Cytochrome P450 n=1 Tax=Auriscalpium vulgare TaxID=40419 RepID=A0ACB8RJM6_9AGAM|nr:cytochrome P450 [Auriscalpium vulgare]